MALFCYTKLKEKGKQSYKYSNMPEITRMTTTHSSTYLSCSPQSFAALKFSLLLCSWLKQLGLICRWQHMRPQPICACVSVLSEGYGDFSWPKWVSHSPRRISFFSHSSSLGQNVQKTKYAHKLRPIPEQLSDFITFVSEAMLLRASGWFVCSRMERRSRNKTRNQSFCFNHRAQQIPCYIYANAIRIVAAR